jgi:transcriptional regulator with XRE-family HTH domain
MSHRHQTLTRFGLNVRRRREAIGLSQEALAEKAELDRTYISGIERGTRNPDNPWRSACGRCAENVSRSTLKHALSMIRYKI